MKFLYLSTLALMLSFSLKSQTNCTPRFVFETIQEYPLGLATDGNNFWVSGRRGITRHDEFGGLLDTVFLNPDLVNSLSGIELYKDTLWCVSEQIPRLYKINSQTGNLYKFFDLPTLNNLDPNNWGIAFDGTHLWNIEYGYFETDSCSFFKIDPSTGESLDTVFVEIARILPIEFINGKMIGISLATKGVYEIDLETGESLYLFEWCLDTPFGLASSPSDQLFAISGIIASGGTQSVYEIEDIDLITSLQELSIKNEKLKITPNPTNGQLSVFSPNLQSGTVVIFNSLGEVLLKDFFQNASFEKDVDSYLAGIYYVQLSDGKQSIVDRFIKVD